MATYKVRYKNHCTPQEQTLSGGRWYLDSDSGRKLTGDAVITDMSGAGTLITGTSVHVTAANLGTNKDFLYIKNTGTVGIDVLISLTTDVAAQYTMVLSDGEAFASKIKTASTIFVKTASDTTTIEYFLET